MIIPLLLNLSYAEIASTPYSTTVEYQIQSPVEDVWSGNARFVQDKKLFGPNVKRKVFMTDDPDFALAHQFSSIGLTTIVVGSITTVGALVAAAIFGTFGAIDGDTTTATNCLKVAGYSTLGVTAGAGASFIGGSIARNILMSKGQSVPFAGGYLASAGVASTITGFMVGNVEWNGIERSEAQRQIGGALLLSGLVAVPTGLLTQHIINRSAYNRYVDSVSLTPTFSPDSVGTMVQVEF